MPALIAATISAGVAAAALANWAAAKGIAVATAAPSIVTFKGGNRATARSVRAGRAAGVVNVATAVSDSRRPVVTDRRVLRTKMSWPHEPGSAVPRNPAENRAADAAIRRGRG